MNPPFTQKEDDHHKAVLEEISFAYTALSKSEFGEWMSNLLFDLNSVPTGAEDNPLLAKQYLKKEEKSE